MIVRTYGRRNRGELRRANYASDPLEEEDIDGGDPFGFSLSHSQDEALYPSSSQEFLLHSSFPFSSQESSSFDPGPTSFCQTSRTSDQRKRARFSNSTTLLETQEAGEMMEHVDEVHFALDGLRACQPVRIRRASLLSLLTICTTQQQRRLLRTQGLAKTIMDAVLNIGFDDPPCNLAAATLFYLLTGDGQDDHLLESTENIRFMLKFLEPVASTVSEERSRNIGTKLITLRKQFDGLRDSTKLVDSSSEALTAKVEDVLVKCKDLKVSHDTNSSLGRSELCAKWIALLIMEKACLSKISLEDFSGSVREAGGNFKDKLREHGGLDAVFEVVRECLPVLENLAEKSFWIRDKRDESSFKSLKLLLKCLKIMENATFLNKCNQCHLLGLKGKANYHGNSLSFTDILIKIIKILSGICLKKCSGTSGGRKSVSHSKSYDSESDFGVLATCQDDIQEVICISTSEESCHTERTFSKDRVDMSQDSIRGFSVSACGSVATTTSVNDSQELKTQSRSCSISDILRSSSCEHTSTSKVNMKHCVEQRIHSITGGLSEPFDDGEDPFAFDEDDYQPSKWDTHHRKRICNRTGRTQRRPSENKNTCQSALINLNKLRVTEGCQKKPSADCLLSNLNASCDNEEYDGVLFDCILSAVKVLMNLTNENPLGCKQIADCGGLETMSSLIAGHFPSFSMSTPSFKMIQAETDFKAADINDHHLNDQELDFLVAILGLLVNLVEKDGNNRSRLAAVTISVDGSCKNVILLLCSIFLTNQGAGDNSSDGNVLPSNDEAAMLQGEKEAEKMIVEAYSALLLAFLSTESKHIRDSIANCLPNNSLTVLVPVLERFLAFHMTLNMISPETHKAVTEIVESCREP